MRWFLPACGAALVLLLARPVRAQQAGTPPSPSPVPSPSASPAPRPKLPDPYVSFEEEWSPDYDNSGTGSSNINLRAQLSYPTSNAGYVIRIKVPYVSSAPPGNVTGRSNTTISYLYLDDTATAQWALGITMRLPTQQNPALGSLKTSIGPSFGYQTQQGVWTLGFFQQNVFSVMGPSTARPVGQSKLEPTVVYSLPAGWQLGTSTMSFTYDWPQRTWVEVPVGLRVQKTFGYPALRPFRFFVEVEQNLVRVNLVPEWTMRAQIRYTFVRP